MTDILVDCTPAQKRKFGVDQIPLNMQQAESVRGKLNAMARQVRAGGRPPTCECGECRKCRARASQQRRRATVD
jgi:hypothetical protein